MSATEGSPVTDTPPVEPRPAIDFTLAGTPLAEWLGQAPHEQVIKAADRAMAIPDERIIAAVVYDDDQVHTHKWAAHERRAIRRWFRSEHLDAPGRLRLTATTEIEPSTRQDVKVISVEYEPSWTPKAKADGGSEA